jgi:hypothetical protein
MRLRILYIGYAVLDKKETMIIVQLMATQQQNQLSQPATVKNRLVEKGWLQTSTEGGKTRYTLKSPIPLEGARQQVWKIDCTHIWPDDGQTWEPAPAAPSPEIPEAD